jgi:prefoldin subunit 5
LDDADAQERIERLTAEKRAAERANEEANAMLSEASKTIEALRDALEATDAARARRRRAD